MRDKYHFKNPETNEIVDVEPVRWTWVAYYNDGTSLKQYDDETGEFHQFKEIDQSKLKIFEMRAWHTQQVFNIDFNPEYMKLIHFYRRAVLQNGQIRLTFFCFGYETQEGKYTKKNLVFIYPDDRVVITDNKDLKVV